MKTQRIPRPYPNLMLAVKDGLNEVFQQGYYADRVVSHLLKRDKRWGSRDRAFIAETLYDCVRWWRLLSFLAESERAEDIISVYWTWKYDTALSAEGFPSYEPAKIEERIKIARQNPAIQASFPDWMDSLAQEEIGEKWTAIRDALNQKASVFLRANSLKCSRNHLQQQLASEGIQTELDPRGEDALKVVKRKNLWRTKAFQNGYFEVQDIASQQIAPLLDIKPGMTVIDACAGAGGKSLHIAALMQNKGRLIALDIHERKLAELKKRAKRAGISNLETRVISSSKIIKRLAGKADRLLLDVPCSGLGVLRRNPDAKWKLKESFLDEVKQTQSEILTKYPKMLKPDGKLLYATCSILPSENNKQTEKFASEENWSIEKSGNFYPMDDYDGFYFSLMSNI